MQLNIHVPKDREAIVAALDAEAAATGRSKNHLVLDALAAYLQPTQRRRRPRLRKWTLGAGDDLHRADLYEERHRAVDGTGAR